MDCWKRTSCDLARRRRRDRNNSIYFIHWSFLLGVLLSSTMHFNDWVPSIDSSANVRSHNPNSLLISISRSKHS